MRSHLVSFVEIRFFIIVIIWTESDSLSLLVKLILRGRLLLFGMTIPASESIATNLRRIYFAILTHIKGSCCGSHFNDVI